MIDSHDLFLLLSGFVAIVLLIVLIAHYKINPFIVLFSVSLILAIVTGMPVPAIVKSFETGVGNILGHIAMVVALGTILGKMMAESGGAERIARTLISAFGEKNVPWAMMVIGIVVGLPVFFEVGFVLLMPIAFNVAKRTGTSLIVVGLPMVAGLSVVHGLVPPHPAALLAVKTFNADMGRTIFYALLVGVPTAVVAGPIYGKWIAPLVKLETNNLMAAQFIEENIERDLPNFGLMLATVLLPVVLILAASLGETLVSPGSIAGKGLHLLGNADIALLLGVLVSFVVLGKMRGFDRGNRTAILDRMPGADRGDYFVSRGWWRIRSHSARQRHFRDSRPTCTPRARFDSFAGVVGGCCHTLSDWLRNRSHDHSGRHRGAYQYARQRRQTRVIGACRRRRLTCVFAR